MAQRSAEIVTHTAHIYNAFIDNEKSHGWRSNPRRSYPHLIFVTFPNKYKYKVHKVSFMQRKQNVTKRGGRAHAVPSKFQIWATNSLVPRYVPDLTDQATTQWVHVTTVQNARWTSFDDICTTNIAEEERGYFFTYAIAVLESDPPKGKVAMSRVKMWGSQWAHCFP